MKKRFFAIYFVFLVLLPINVLANENELVDIDLYIDQEGNGHFQTTYVYEDYEGTEHYIVLENLEGRSFENFKVTRNGMPMNFEENWDIDASLEEKSGKYGLVQTQDGYELCFGISEYGTNEFLVEYTITDIVKVLNDYDMLSWRFLNTDLSEDPQEIRLRIYSDEAFNQEDIRMWAFGFEGVLELEDGQVVAYSMDDFRYNHMTVLLRFEKGIFAGGLAEDEYFDYYADLMFLDSEYDQTVDPDAPVSDEYIHDAYDEPGSGGIIGFIASLFPFLIGIVAFMSSIALFGKSKAKLDYDKDTIYQDGYYYRDTQDMPIEDFYYLLVELDESNFEHYISAYFLKWIRENRISLIESQKGLIRKKDVVEFKLEDSQEPMDTYLEKRLFNLLASAAGEDRILQEREFSKYISSNPSSFETLIDQFYDNSKDQLTEDDFIERHIKKRPLKDKITLSLSPKGERLARELVGFKSYLEDYSLLEERDAINVHLWDTYMIYAAMYGITEKVQEQFENLYPSYIQESYYSPSVIYWSNHYSKSFINSYNNAVASASSAQASGGFGGGTSFGGGGGGFGGGGSGGGSR